MQAYFLSRCTFFLNFITHFSSLYLVRKSIPATFTGPHHLPALTGLKPPVKPSRTGFDQLSSNHKPELAKAAVSASWLAASQAAATLLCTMAD